MTPWSMFRTIKTALDSEDVEGLLALGCPTDEYDGEASLIEDRLAKTTNFGERPLSATQVEKILAEVWDFKFGPFTTEALNKRRPAFASIARKIAK